MDELIRKLREWTFWCGSTHKYSHDIHPNICDDAADALEKLQAQLAQITVERDAAREFACAYCRIIPCRKNKCPCWSGPKEDSHDESRNCR